MASPPAVVILRLMAKCLTGLLVAALSSLFFVWSQPAGADQKDGRLDPLFARLKATNDPREAGGIADEIWRIWTHNGDPKVEAKMEEGLSALTRRRFESALAAFDAIVRMAPDFAEGWNKRATVYYLVGRYDESARDVERTLALEPRHFGALSGLGLIHAAKGEGRLALKAFEDALAVNPHMPEVRARAKALKELLEGKQI